MRIKPTFNKATLRVFAVAITAVMCTLVILSAVFPFPEGTYDFLSIGTSQKASANPDWLSGGWDQRVQITIDAGDIDSDLTHFPVLLHLSSSCGINSDDVTCVFDELASDANRKKIAVTKSDATTQLYVEIETWDDANEEAWLWVSNSTWAIDDATNTTLYLYYDADHADNTDYVGDTQSTPATSVWDSNFKFRSDMKDVTNSTIQDSTSNANNGTKTAANEPIGVKESAPIWETIVATGAGYDNGRNAVIDGNYFYGVSSTPPRLVIYDISTPTAPIQKSLTDITYGCVDVKKKGNYLLISATTGDVAGLLVYNVSNVTAPSYVTSLDWNESVHGMYLDGNYLYCCCHIADKLRIVDVTDPTSPVAKGYVSGTTYFNGVHDVWVSGNYAYTTQYEATTGQYGITVVNITDKDNPAVITGVGEAHKNSSLIKKGDYLYAGSHDPDLGITIYDISTPTSPSYIGRMLTEYGRSVGYWWTTYGEYLATIAILDPPKVIVLDLTDPEDPAVIAEASVGGLVRILKNIVTTGDYFYITADYNADTTHQWILRSYEYPFVGLRGIGEAQRHDGDNEKIDCGNNATLLPSSQITIESLIKFNVVTANMGLVGWWQNAGSGYSYVLRSAGLAKRPHWNIIVGGVSKDLGWTADINDSDWHHVVGVYDGSYVRLYVDSVEATPVAATGVITGSSDKFVIGAYALSSGNYYHAGIIDEVRLSDTGRSAAWIKATYETTRDHLLDWGSEEPLTIEITNTPDSKDFGVLPVNTTSNTAINYFTLNNTGNCPVDVVIYATDVTGGDDTWDLSDTATPEENVYGLYAGLDDADDLFDIIVRETVTYNTLVSDLAEDATQAWGLKIYMPTSVANYDGQQMSGTITLVASESS